jgi:hypothetical protein
MMARDAVFPAGVLMFLRKATFPVNVLGGPWVLAAQIHDADPNANPSSDPVSLWIFGLRLGRDTTRAWTSS